jgi:hypothetical protein
MQRDEGNATYAYPIQKFTDAFFLATYIATRFAFLSCP